jgi:hypothetical protein
VAHAGEAFKLYSVHVSPGTASSPSKDSKHFFFREKRSKKASSVWLGAAATDEAHAPLIATPKLGVKGSARDRSHRAQTDEVLFASFSFRKKKTLLSSAHRAVPPGGGLLVPASSASYGVGEYFATPDDETEPGP